jgi:rare lipoprotein A
LPPVPPAGPGHVDHSGRTQKGRGSFYAKSFNNKKMADGHRMNPNSNIAASKTLPLGSVAKVKNLDNGKTATVKIEDRGPYVDGRVVDLAPKVADDLDMKGKGSPRWRSSPSPFRSRMAASNSVPERPAPIRRRSGTRPR